MDSSRIISSCVMRDASCEKNTQYAIRNTQYEQVAKDFESVLLNKLLGEMKDTIGDWGFEKDGVCEQVQGIFWLYLAQDIANQGGLGLWKDIYESYLSADRFLTGAESATGGTAESLNKNI